MQNRTKISLTLRNDLLQWLKDTAPRENKSVSRLIEDLLLPKMEEDLQHNI